MDLPANKILGFNLRQWRVEHDISVIDIVKAVEIDQRYYQRIEGGDENPSFNTLTRVNGFLKMPWDRMMPPIGCLCAFLPYQLRRRGNGRDQSSRS